MHLLPSAKSAAIICRQTFPKGKLSWCCWVYFLLLIAVWAIPRFAADQWWLATLVLFGPRWLAAMPLLVLVPLTYRSHKPLLLVLTISAWLCAFPILGFCVPWRLALNPRSSGHRIRLLSCNIHGAKGAKQALRNLIDQTRPDVVALQEYEPDQPSVFTEPAWHVIRSGELLIASRFPIVDGGPVEPEQWRKESDTWFPGQAHYCLVQAGGRSFPIITLHLASPHPYFSAAVHLKDGAADGIDFNTWLRMREARMLSASTARLGGGTILAGDFNTPAESPLFRQEFKGVSDAFSTAGLGFGWTYYHDGTAIRIDHVLYGQDWRCTGCNVMGDIDSPHRPLIADFVRVR